MRMLRRTGISSGAGPSLGTRGEPHTVPDFCNSPTKVLKARGVVRAAIGVGWARCARERPAIRARRVVAGGHQALVA